MRTEPGPSFGGIRNVPPRRHRAHRPVGISLPRDAESFAVVLPPTCRAIAAWPSATESTHPRTLWLVSSSQLPRTPFLARLYPFKLHSKAFRLDALRTLAALLQCPVPRATAEKLRGPTTPYVPAPKHQRRSGGFCGTTPPAGRLLCSAPFAGERTR